MSQLLLNRNPILQKFVHCGLHIRISGMLLEVLDIPYINSNMEINYGVILSQLVLNGNNVGKPTTHVVYFQGGFPCDQYGREISVLRHSDSKQSINGVIVDRSFSNKNEHSYDDEYSKVMNYINVITAPVHLINPKVTPYNYKQPILTDDDPSYVFNYIDTNSTRAHIDSLNHLFTSQQIGIIGLGGTGGYILDLVAKTPVKIIHLFDDDKFHSHNAFRAPGAPSIDELNGIPSKVSYFMNIYLKMHKKIVGHETRLSSANIDILNEVNFVFICIDASEDKKCIVDYLNQNNIAFVDVGIDVNYINSITSTVRTVFVHSNTSERWKNKISYYGKNPVYESNLQIAELNSIAAIFAVIQWKKYIGFYNGNRASNILQFVIEEEILINED